MAPPWAGPHKETIPALIQANGLAKELPVILTVDVEAFYSWSACVIKMTSMALTILGSITNSSSKGLENII